MQGTRPATSGPGKFPLSLTPTSQRNHRVLTWINVPICKKRCCEFGRGSFVVLYSTRDRRKGDAGLGGASLFPREGSIDCGLRLSSVEAQTGAVPADVN